jgi:basic amino acid/polyamine antiporter, APA family
MGGMAFASDRRSTYSVGMEKVHPEAMAHPGLLRVLGPWMGTALVIGTVIGSGVFKKPYAVTQVVPEFGLAMCAWVVAGLLALLGSFALAELAVLLPRAGGNYVYLREGFGRWAGFLYGWVEFWIIRSASIAALAAIFAESLHGVLRGTLTADGAAPVLPAWGEQVITIAAIAALALVNIRGTRWGGGLQLIVTIVKVLSLVAIAVLPFVAYFLASDPGARPSGARLEPVWPDSVGAVSWQSFGAAMVGVWWAYHGWMNMAPMAEEVRNPNRNIPLALIAGVLTVIVLYLSANLAYYLILPREVILAEGGDMPVAALFCRSVVGNAGMAVVSAAIMVSVFGALNGNLLVGPRILFAMGKDRLAPFGLASIHPTFHTPVQATLTLAGWSILLVAGVAVLINNPLPTVHVAGWELNINVQPGAGAFDVLTDYAMFGSFSFETLAVASLFALRRRYPADKVALPYRCPLYPLPPLVYVVAMSAVLFNMFSTKPAEALFAVGFIAVGALIYWLALARPQR